MSKIEWHRISKAIPSSNRVVTLEFSDQTVYNFDLKPFIKKGNVFENLLDDDIFFKVQIGAKGRSLEFPNEIDFCADSLWLKAHPNELI